MTDEQPAIVVPDTDAGDEAVCRIIPALYESAKGRHNE